MEAKAKKLFVFVEPIKVFFAVSLCLSTILSVYPQDNQGKAPAAATNQNAKATEPDKKSTEKKDADAKGNDFSAALGGSAGGNSPSAISFGGRLQADYVISPKYAIAVGLMAEYGGDFTDIYYNHTEILGRWYFFNIDAVNLSFFAQAEAGLIVISNRSPINGLSSFKPDMTFTGGIGAGARITFPINAFAELSVRGAYPQLWGVNLALGYTFKGKPSPSPALPPKPEAQKPKEEPKPEVKPEPVAQKPKEEAKPEVKPEVKPEPKPVAQKPKEEPKTEVKQEAKDKPQAPAEPPLPPTAALETVIIDYGNRLGPATQNGSAYQFSVSNIIFRGNSDDFNDLDAQTIARNNKILSELAKFFIAHPDYNVLIVGHANPVQTEAAAKRNEEKLFLEPLTKKRAEAVMKMLIDRGVPASRLKAEGRGGKEPIASISDKENDWKNRRVEFILTQSGKK
jgi:outer membrane protein OmpA-like peptidoglycan-associated protein